MGDLGELDRVVDLGEERLGGVEADLLGVDVEGGHELDVADVVAAELDVHQAGHAVGRVGVLVVGEALHQGAGAVAHAGDGEADLAHVGSSWRCACAGRRGGAGALGLDEAVEPGEVVGEVVGVALEQRAEVGVGAAGGPVVSRRREVVAPAEQLGAAALEQLEAGRVGRGGGRRRPAA